MSNLIKLRQLLQPRAQPAEGKVIAVTAAGLKVTTRTGNRDLKLQAGDVTAYRLNDRVRFIGDIVTGKIGAAIEVYQL